VTLPKGWIAALIPVIVVALVLVLLVDPYRSPPSRIPLSTAEQALLLSVVRNHLEAILHGQPPPELDASGLPRRLLQFASCFVTLTADDTLRGCMIDQFIPHEPLYVNAMRNAVLAAKGDDRFSPLTAEDLDDVRIEISIVGPLRELNADDPDHLTEEIEPGHDGVLLTTAYGTSTFLPGVWEQIPDPSRFLTQLCHKQSAPGDCWRSDDLVRLQVYEVHSFAEGTTDSD
jgi:AmmeMemoRadiSam system protein A